MGEGFESPLEVFELRLEALLLAVHSAFERLLLVQNLLWGLMLFFFR